MLRLKKDEMSLLFDKNLTKNVIMLAKNTKIFHI